MQNSKAGSSCRPLLGALALGLSLFGCALPAMKSPATDSREAVVATERAFAQSMADRDHQAFARFISDEAVFLSGSKALRGKQEVVQAWAGYFTAPQAPFSWQPETVEVLASGDLALSTGPVRDGNGKLVATFTSIWRLEAPGTWRIVFDKGNEVCQ